MGRDVMVAQKRGMGASLFEESSRRNSMLMKNVIAHEGLGAMSGSNQSVSLCFFFISTVGK